MANCIRKKHNNYCIVKMSSSPASLSLLPLPSIQVLWFGGWDVAIGLPSSALTSKVFLGQSYLFGGYSLLSGISHSRLVSGVCVCVCVHRAPAILAVL